MSGPQWENLPEPKPNRQPTPLTASWQGFTADPRDPSNQPLRAADADRDFAARLLEQARVDGRLSLSEYTDRATAAGGARTLGELVPLVGDVMVPQSGARPAGVPRRVRWFAIRGWVALAVLFNAIWLMTVLTTGRLLYYWPMWPMFGTAIPMVIALIAGDAGDQRAHRGPRREPPRQLPPGHDLR